MRASDRDLNGAQSNSLVSETACGHDSPESLRAARSLHGKRKFAEAEKLLHVAITLDPKNFELWNARGVMMAAMRRYVDAIWCYREALTWNSEAAGAWTNLGNALTELKQHKSATICHRRAIAISGRGDALLYHNLGASLAQAGSHGEAIIAYSRALDITPDYHSARWDRGRSYLYLGNYRQGWADHEVRLISGLVTNRDLPGKKWDGSPYSGQRLVLLAEQGFGDMIWVARYLPRVKALGGTLIIECRRELVTLIAAMGVADDIVARSDPLPPADLYCHVCSLPGLFTPDVSSIPASPYLLAPRSRLAKFRNLFDAVPGRLKVGIIWSGSITFKKNHERAQMLASFLRVFAIPGVQLFSLQKGPPEREISALPKGSPIIDLSPFIADFADTAAAVAQLDLVIMTDSAVAHLAGAIGKPVWILLGQGAHWLWLLDRTDSPWYSTVRLFRPTGAGSWDFVLTRPRPN